jgi:hypothetical protein
MVQHVKHRDIVETSSSEGQALRIGLRIEPWRRYNISRYHG